MYKPRHGPHSTESTAPVLLAACIARCITTVAARTTENTSPVLLAACVLRALPSNGSISHNMKFNIVKNTHNREDNVSDLIINFVTIQCLVLGVLKILEIS
jgi:hypothetical protein